MATANGANAEIVLHSTTGFLVAGRNQWVDSLSRLVSDASLRQRQGEAGRRRAEAEYDVAQIARQVSALLKGEGNGAGERV